MTSNERALIDAALALTSRLNVEETCAAMLDVVEQIFEARSSWILLHDRRSDHLVTAAFRGPGAETFADLDLPADRGIIGLAFSTGEPVFVPDVNEEDRWFDPERVHGSGLPSVFTVPLLLDTERIGTMGFFSPRFGPGRLPTDADRALLQGLGALASLGIKNARLFQEVQEERLRRTKIAQQRRQLRDEIGHLRDELRSASAYGTVIGRSPRLQAVLEQAAIVAPADTTVLVLGETGTGKELIARAIHAGSRRARGTFVAVNCAAMPATLIESELFGHEKGAFTGAAERKPGKFELADRGTLFLDEIGDLPAEAQAKLLRVLQDGEVQRIGGTRPVAVNVRVIAATNQDLAMRMEAGQFRPDLFYRLSVFPMQLPALRERREDIPLLVEHFAAHFAGRQHTRIPPIEPQTMARLEAYDWPGNVRELQNVIERAVILARGGAIRDEMILLPERHHAQAAPVAPAQPDAPPAAAGAEEAAAPLALAEAERRAIRRALESTGWRISGAGGAAERLALKPTTLHAKMKKLGIRRPGAKSS